MRNAALDLYEADAFEEPFFPFRMELEIYTHQNCERGKFRHLSTIPSTHLLGCSEMVEKPVPIATAGDTMVVLRRDTELALFHLKTCQMLSTILLPDEVHCFLKAKGEEGLCWSSTAICFDGLRTVLVSVPGDVLGIDIQGANVSWRLSDLLPHLVLVQACPTAVHHAGKLRSVVFEPVNVSPHELVDTVRLTPMVTRMTRY